MGRKKRAVKTENDKKASEKTEKMDISTPEEAIIEDDQSMLPKKDLFRVDEVATYFSISESTVRLWIQHGHLTAIKKPGSIKISRKSILDCHILDRRKVA